MGQQSQHLLSPKAVNGLAKGLVSHMASDWLVCFAYMFDMFHTRFSCHWPCLSTRLGLVNSPRFSITFRMHISLCPCCFKWTSPSLVTSKFLNSFGCSAMCLKNGSSLYLFQMPSSMSIPSHPPDITSTSDELGGGCSDLPKWTSSVESMSVWFCKGNLMNPPHDHSKNCQVKLARENPKYIS